MSQVSFRPFVAALSLAVASAGFGVSAHAAQSADAATTATQQVAGKKVSAEGHHHGHHGHHGKHHNMMRGAIMVPGLGPINKKVVESLKLTDAQQAQVKEARDAQRAAFKQMREAGKSRHQALAAQLEGGKIDPRALLAERGKSRDAFRPQFEEIQNKWLAVWDGLDEAQQAQIATHLKERQARIAERKARSDKARSDKS